MYVLKFPLVETQSKILQSLNVHTKRCLDSHCVGLFVKPWDESFVKLMECSCGHQISTSTILETLFIHARNMQKQADRQKGHQNLTKEPSVVSGYLGVLLDQLGKLY